MTDREILIVEPTNLLSETCRTLNHSHHQATNYTVMNEIDKASSSFVNLARRGGEAAASPSSIEPSCPHVIERDTACITLLEDDYEEYNYQGKIPQDRRMQISKPSVVTSNARLDKPGKRIRANHDDGPCSKRARGGCRSSSGSHPPRPGPSIVALKARPEKAKAQQTQPSLSSLPEELLYQVGSFLNVSSLNNARLCCRRFNDLLKSDHSGWAENCQRLWKFKAHVLPAARQVVPGGTIHVQGPESKLTSITTDGLLQLSTAFDAYRLSCIDAKLRQELHRDHELVYDPLTGTGTVWSFRFKQAAGREWTDQDPWHHGRAARQLVFLSNGTVREFVASPSDGAPELFLPFGDGTHQNGVETLWRFVSQPLDLPKRMDGAYIRLTVGGRDVPTYLVKRSPTGNWGFVMENCWSVFASFPMAPLPTGAEEQSFTSTTSKVNEDDLARSNDLADSSLTVTSSWQWREALLYNLGASILPDASTFNSHSAGGA